MIKLLLDTNIIIDYLRQREPFFEKTRLLMILGYTHEVELWIASSQITDLIYKLTDDGRRSLMSEVMYQLRKLRQFIDIFAVGQNDVDKMLLTSWKDPENFLLYQCALSLKADAIITRNANDFEEQLIKICNCDEFFEWIYKTTGVRYSLEGLDSCSCEG